MKVFIGIFIILHGLVHLFYFAHSKRIFELRPGMEWPDNSLALSKFMGIKTIRDFTSLICSLVAVAFVISGIAYLAKAAWAINLAIISVFFSSLLFILLWDGRFKKLDNQGAIAILINISIWFVLNSMP
jgi:hypothetical protein